MLRMAQSLHLNLCLSVMNLQNKVFFSKIKKKFAFKTYCLYNSQSLCSSSPNVEHIVGIAKLQSRGSVLRTRFKTVRPFVGPVKYRGYGIGFFGDCCVIPVSSTVLGVTSFLG